jgi:hypothetical protein
VIEVWDSDPNPPAMKGEDLDAESGRGIHIISEVAHRWGSYPTRSGKVVWAELVVPPRPSNAPPPPLPKRIPRPMPEPTQPIAREHDPELLKRLIDGLHDLE